MKKRKINIGIIGCGNISAKYLHSLTEIFQHTNVVALSDLHLESAQKRAKQFNIPRICASNKELLAMENIEVIVVLTTPQHHYDVVSSCLQAGKHTYVEKPLSLNASEGKRLVALANEKNVLLSGAPDTLLGAGIQTARKLMEDGWIGTPIASISHILTGGPESWHPNPAFLYHKGAGPLYDVAPYYVAGLSYLFGPVESVMCAAKQTYKQRMIGSQPLYGTMIDVEVPTYLTGILRMKNGVISTIHHSFDVNHTKLDNSVEIYGTSGTLIIPSPCNFSGNILYRGKNDLDWSTIPPLFAYQSDCRGIGAADLADALLNCRKPRLDGDFVFHTLDVLTSLDQSAQMNESVRVTSQFTATEPMPLTDVWGPDKTWTPSD